ncbi:hypothetical protein CSW77_26465, partial [Shigella flexneri]
MTVLDKTEDRDAIAAEVAQYLTTEQISAIEWSRVSQINGCRTCLSIHAPAARKAGVSQLKLDVLPSWHEAEIFTDQEFAALTLAESLTVLDKTEDRDAIAAEVAQYLTTEQISAIEWS